MTAALLDSPPLDVYGQMALDEALLDAGQADFALRFFRWAPGSRPSMTFGYFQRYKEIATNGVPCARRPTGGGIVHHVDDVTFSFAFKWDGTLSPQAIYKNIHRGVHVGLKQTLKLKTALWSPPGWRDVPKCETKDACECFTKPEPMDLVWTDDTKVLGGALRRRAGRVLYQGSLQMPQGDPKDLERAVTHGFEVEWGAPFVPQEAGMELLKVAEERRVQYQSDAWNHKR